MPRVRIRTLMIAVAVFAVALGGAAWWRKEQRRRADLLMLAKVNASFARLLRLQVRSLPKDGRTEYLGILGERMEPGYSSGHITSRSGAEGMTPAEVAKVL